MLANKLTHQTNSSNATHVRLLNASLESEGLYACEISSQNLSTIRYEREIRVYGKFMEANLGAHCKHTGPAQ